MRPNRPSRNRELDDRDSREQRPPFFTNDKRANKKDLMRSIFLNDISIDEIRRDIASINIYYDELSYTYISEKSVS